jgi:hypothetical protein
MAIVRDPSTSFRPLYPLHFAQDDFDDGKEVFQEYPIESQGRSLKGIAECGVPWECIIEFLFGWPC